MPTPTTDVMAYRCSCGQQLTVQFVHHGYLEYPRFQHDGQGVQLCPGCGYRLVYYECQVVRPGGEIIVKEVQA